MKSNLLIFLLLFSVVGCGEKHQEHKLSIAGNFKALSPWYSFDQKYKMVVYKDGTLVILDAHKSASDSQTQFKGKWTVDEQAKIVSISLSYNTDSFIYFEPTRHGTSVLVKGSLENANLRQSWFSNFDEDAYEEEPTAFDRL